MAGLLDLLFGNSNNNTNNNNTNPNSSNGDAAAAYLGNLIDPATAQQFQQANAQRALLGLSAGLLSGSGPSRMPVPFGSALGQGLLGMMQSEGQLPQQALQSAQTQNTLTDAQLKRLQGMGLLQNMSFMQSLDAAHKATQGAAPGQSLTSGPISQPGAAATAQPGAVSSNGADTAARVGNVLKNEFGWADGAVAGALNNGFGESHGAAWNNPGPGGEQGFFQFHPRSHLPLFLQQFNGDVSPEAQGRYVGQWVNQNMPNYGKIDDPRVATGQFLHGFEAPTDQSQKVLDRRFGFNDQSMGILSSLGQQSNSSGQSGATSQTFSGGANGAMLPPGMTPQEYQANRDLAFYSTLLGKGVPPDTAKAVTYPFEAALANQNAMAQQGARAGFAGVRAYNQGLGGSPFEMVHTQIGDRELDIPKAQYLQMFGGAQNPFAAQAGLLGQPQNASSPSGQPPSVPSIAGSNLAPGGILAPQAAPSVGMTPPQANTTAPLLPAPIPPGTGTVMAGSVNDPRAYMPSGRPALPPGTPYNSNGQPYSPSLLTMSPQERANAVASEAFIRNNPTSWLGSPASAPNAPARPVAAPGASPVSAAPAAAPTMIPPGLGKPVGPNAYTYRPMFGKGPGQDQPVPVPPAPGHPYATVMPPLSDQTPISRSSPAAFDELRKGWDDTTQKLTGTLPDIQTSQQLLTSMANLFKRYESGSFAEHLSDWAADLKAAGFTLPANINDPAAMEQILKDNFAASLSKMKATGLQRWTQMELKSTSQNFANPNLQPAANFNIISQDMGKITQSEAFVSDWMNARRNGWGGSLEDFENAWYNRNPLQSFVDRAKVQIGQFKGMNQDEVSREIPKTHIRNGISYVESGGKYYPMGAQ